MSGTGWGARSTRSRWPWWRRVWRELVWGLDADDGTGDGSPSATKIAGLTLIGLVVYSVVSQKAITATHIVLSVAAISALFGRSMWRTYLRRKGGSGGGDA